MNLLSADETQFFTVLSHLIVEATISIFTGDSITVTDLNTSNMAALYGGASTYAGLLVILVGVAVALPGVLLISPTLAILGVCIYLHGWIRTQVFSIRDVTIMTVLMGYAHVRYLFKGS